MKRMLILLFLVIVSLLFFQFQSSNEDKFVIYETHSKQGAVAMYFKDANGIRFGSIENLKIWLNKNNKELLFAMNGGMYKNDKSPVGLYIEKGKTITNGDHADGTGNFYLKPNGIFYLNAKGVPTICKTEDFQFKDGSVDYATQSGPMLVIAGKIHPTFNKDSNNFNIRNGVGVLPNGQLVFAMSKKEVNFYEFATFFKEKGCKNALYLDGFVSRAYCPNQDWVQTDGDFGVIIAVTKNK